MALTVEEREARLQEDVESLWDTLTDYRCTSHADIASVTDWPMWKVGQMLAYIRYPANAQEWGWTVPHVPHGRGDHWYQVILTENNGPLDEEQVLYINEGAVSTLRHTETMGMNEAHALRTAATHAPAADARRMRRTAQAFEGAAAMAGDMAEKLAEQTR